MLKTVYAVGAAAIVVGAFVGFLSLSMQVEAHARASAAKGDRADIRTLARDCSQHAWPYFEAGCLRDTRNPFGQAAKRAWLRRRANPRHQHQPSTPRRRRAAPR